MPETSEHPLVQAMKSKTKKPDGVSSSEDLLKFILSNFSMTPKESEKPISVVTQESHTP